MDFLSNFYSDMNFITIENAKQKKKLAPKISLKETRWKTRNLPSEKLAEEIKVNKFKNSDFPQE